MTLKVMKPVNILAPITVSMTTMMLNVKEKKLFTVYCMIKEIRRRNFPVWNFQRKKLSAFLIVITQFPDQLARCHVQVYLAMETRKSSNL